MKNLKGTDTVVLSLELTAKEARGLRDLIFRTVAQAEEDVGMTASSWSFPAGVAFDSYTEFAQRREFVDGTVPGLKKVYYALRSALRMPKEEMTFRIAYEHQLSDARRIELFGEWLDEQKRVLDFISGMGHDYEKKDIREGIERMTCLLGSNGATLDKGYWHWNKQEFNTWDQVKQAMMTSYRRDPAAWQKAWRLRERIKDSLQGSLRAALARQYK